MTKRKAIIVSDPLYRSSVWFQELLAGFQDAAAKGREDVQTQVYNMDQIPELTLDPHWPVIVTNSSFQNLTVTIAELQRRGVPIILSGMDGVQFGAGISSVTCDRILAMSQMVQYLIYHGKHRIALVGFWPSSKNDMAYCDAAVAASNQFGHPIQNAGIFLWKKELTDSLQQFLREYKNYDVAICPNDTIAVSLARFCREQGIHVPKELFITGASNMNISQAFEPSITTIDMDFRKIGEETHFVWSHMLQHDYKCSCIRLYVHAQIIPRNSTANLPFTEQAISKVYSMASSIDRENGFFMEPMINSLMRLENCLSIRDETDLKIIAAIAHGKSYEEMEEMLYMSGSAIRYRRNRIFQNAGVSSRAEFEKLLMELSIV